MTTDEATRSAPKAIKLNLGSLKKFDDFQNWRYMLKSSICADSGLEDIASALAFIKQVESSDVTFDALYSTRDPVYGKLDMALFNGLIKALESSIDGALVITSIRTKVEFGCGRQALRLVDKYYSHEADRLVSNAMQKLFSLRCNSVNNIGEFLTSFQYLEKESGNCLGEPVKLELLRRDLRNFRELDALFAVWKNDLNPDSKSLVERLESFDVERRGSTRDKAPARAHPASQSTPNPHADRTCYYCNKQGHIKPDCRSFLRDKESGNVKPNAKGSKGGKGSVGKGGKGGKGGKDGKGKDKDKGQGKGYGVIEEEGEKWDEQGGSWQWIALPDQSSSIEQSLALLVQDKLNLSEASCDQTEGTRKSLTDQSFC